MTAASSEQEAHRNGRRAQRAVERGEAPEEIGQIVPPLQSVMGDQWRAIAAAEQLSDTDLGRFADVAVYENEPLFTRHGQLDFPADLPVAEINRELISAALSLLDRIDRQVAVPNHLVRMVSITSWWTDDDQWGACSDGTTEIIRPGIFVANLNHERMKGFRLHRPHSTAASFVAQVTGPAYEVLEERLLEANAWCPNWVYVAPPGRLPAAAVEG
ncbi:hypothetical protein ACFVWG_22205 [Kribbella sp. NPDC058245]|uniref:hypothetical protein n=1 Tax=Kribbella sp. NPDC058245 TaxID=3346399 RepID=UPI0036E6388A